VAVPEDASSFPAAGGSPGFGAGAAAVFFAGGSLVFGCGGLADFEAGGSPWLCAGGCACPVPASSAGGLVAAPVFSGASLFFAVAPSSSWAGFVLDGASLASDSKPITRRRVCQNANMSKNPTDSTRTITRGAALVQPGMSARHTPSAIEHG
jgi:hypothetical protein